MKMRPLVGHMEGGIRSLGRAARGFVVATVTPLLEKNPAKTVSLGIPLVFSMARLIVLAFAFAMLHQVWYAGVAGWPDATLSIAIVLALPILGAMERVSAEDVVTLAKTLLSRFGEGATRSLGSLYPLEPSKYDDHQDDGDGSTSRGAA